MQKNCIKIEIKNIGERVAKMFFDIKDNHQWKELTGGCIIKHPPLYSRNGDHIMFINEQIIKIYSTITGKFIRSLESNVITSEIASFQLELEYDDVIIACSRLGELVRWYWPTGEVKDSLKLKQTSKQVDSFHLLNMYGESSMTQALLIYKMNEIEHKFQCEVINRENGDVIRKCSNLLLKSKGNTVLIAVDSINFPNLVIGQDQYINFVNYSTWASIRYRNPHGEELTALQMHPTEECCASGDAIGRVFLWRKFDNASTLTTSLYHWHHTAVTSIAFTPTGASFYSSGEEAVLVCWNVHRPELRHFMPRMSSRIRHVTVGPNNAQYAICTFDNSVQLIGTEKKIQQNLQEFTYIADDKTGRFKFPVGLRWNPRTNTIVLNGRSGSLQFYNTHTKNLLYNLNIVNENLLSMERDRILYDTRVVKAAFNIDWMATGEVFNDEEHFPEVRLKFWRYMEEQRSYALITSIEFPHEGGFQAIEFSHEYRVDNLLCATVGEDNIIKMWSTENSNNINHSGKTWYCIAQATYKSMPIKSISFSQDASLLAAGFANILCIYKADKLQLKATLTPPVGMDGCVHRVLVKVPKVIDRGLKPEIIQKQKEIIKLFNEYSQNKNDILIRQLSDSKSTSCKESHGQQIISAEALSDKQKLSIYCKIMEMFELNLFQKVRIFQHLHICCKHNPKYQKYFNSYYTTYLKYFKGGDREQQLLSKVSRVNRRERFKAKYRLDLFMKRNELIKDFLQQKLIDSLKVLSIKPTKEDPRFLKDLHSQQKLIDSPKANQQTKNSIKPLPLTIIPQITFVQFAVDKYAQLVVVCMPHRILIWNIFTLRLYATLKLTTQYISFDNTTNLFAAATHNNELHVFQPDGKLSLYQRRNLPEIYGIIWVPRRIHKKSSIIIDWQAKSTLYFLTKEQKLIYLAGPKEGLPSVPTPFVFDNPATKSFSYSTFGVSATKAIIENTEMTESHKGPLIFGRSAKQAVEKLINMSSHTMPPASQMVESFLKAIAKQFDITNTDEKTTTTTSLTSATTTAATKPQLNGYMKNMNGTISSSNDSDTRDEDGAGDSDIDDHIPNLFKRRKELLKQTEEYNRKYLDNDCREIKSFVDYDESKLMAILKSNFNIDL